MKTKLNILIICLSILMSCENEIDNSQQHTELKVTDIVYSDCNDSIITQSIHLKMISENILKITHYGAEFCCEDTGKVDIELETEYNLLKIIEIDSGAPSYCFCKFKLEFLINGILNGEHIFKIIESEHSYIRDTLSFKINLNMFTDTLIKFDEIIAKENPKIIDIVSYPNIYEGKTVIIDGKFGGWSGTLPCCYEHMGGVTRSDVIIYDDTGCIYLTYNYEVLDKEKELDPWVQDNIGANLKIKTIVSLHDGKAYLGHL